VDKIAMQVEGRHTITDLFDRFGGLLSYDGAQLSQSRLDIGIRLVDIGINRSDGSSIRRTHDYPPVADYPFLCVQLQGCWFDLNLKQGRKYFSIICCGIN
jgi:hypothetical protein